MKTYESMKPSTVFWLGMIPEHWEERFLEQTCHEKCVKNIGNTESNVLSLSYGYIIKKKNVYSGLVAKDFSTYQIVQNDDIILRFTDLQNDHKSLRTGLVTQTGIITSAYTCIVPTINSAYLHYLLHAYDLRKVFYGMGGGVRQSIGYKDVRHMTVLVPPREEQDQIVRFLDWKVSEINKLINNKKRQITYVEKLKTSEIMQKFIFSASDKTQRVRLKNVAKSYGRIGFRGYSTTDMVDEGEGAITTSPSNIEQDRMSFEKCSYLSWEKYEESPEIQLRKNDILIVKTGSSYGKTGFIENDLVYKATINPQLLIIRSINTSVLPKYLYFFIKYGNIQEQICKNVIGSTIPTISESRIMNMSLLLPRYESQIKIANEIQEIIDKYFKLINILESEISVLQEFKTRLISDVVTGKIDVRGIEIPEYEYTAEESDIDEKPDLTDGEQEYD